MAEQGREQRRELSPPYAPWSEMQATLRRLERFTPPRVDIAFLKMHRIAPKNERAVINALKYLGIIDEEGLPTDRLSTLQQGDYASELAAIVRHAYTDLLQRVDLRDASTETINNYFLTRKVAPSVAPKCTRFFLGICEEASIEVAPGLAVRGTQGEERTRSRERPTPHTETSPAGRRAGKEPVGRRVAVVTEYRNGATLLEAKLRLFEKLPNFDASWKPESIQLVFQEFHRLADRLEGKYTDKDEDGSMLAGKGNETRKAKQDAR